MGLLKVARDHISRLVVQAFVPDYRPKSLVELKDYFYHYHTINFDYHQGDNGRTIAVSNNFYNGSIVTSGNDKKDLDSNIKDAILTAFNVPSSYAGDAGITEESSRQGQYAPA